MSTSEMSFSKLLLIARDEKRIQETGENFCEACNEMVSLVIPYIEKMIGENPKIKDSLKTRDAYLIDTYTQKSKMVSIIDKIFIKNFEDYKIFILRLPAVQIDALLNAISDRLEGANLGYCKGVWHRVHQKCWDCPLRDFCVSNFKDYDIKVRVS